MSIFEIPAIDINNAFLKHTSELVERHVPGRKFTRKELRFIKKTWISKRIQNMIEARDRILKKLKSDKSLRKKTLYKKVQNNVDSELKRCKTQYFQDYFIKYIKC